MSSLADAQLVRKAKGGHAGSWAELLQRYSRKISVVARRWKLVGYEIEDREQVARMGFIKAVRTFKEDGGRSFDTWAELVVNQAMVMVYRKLTSDAAVPPGALRSSDEQIGDDLTLGESIANPECERVYEVLGPRIKRLEARQARLLRQHLERPMESDLGEVLFLWVSLHKGTEAGSLILDVCDRSPMIRTMRFGHDGDVFEACGDQVEALFWDFLIAQRRLIVKLNSDARWGHPAHPDFAIGPVWLAMRKMLLKDPDFEALPA